MGVGSNFFTPIAKSLKNALYFQASQGTKLRLNIKRDGTIAQLVEQRTFNPFVVGSTPAGPTKNLKRT